MASSPPSLPPPSNHHKWIYTLLKNVTTVYLIMFVVVFLGQSFFIFPGAFMTSKTDAKSLPPNYEIISLDRSDGSKFRIIQAVPHEPPAVVLLFFGGNGEHFDHLVRRASHFLKYSAIVIAAEPAGWGNSSGPLNVHTQLLLSQKVGEYAQKLATKNQLQLAVIGSSLGSFSALHTISLGIGDKLLLHAPLTSLEDLAASIYWYFPVRTFLNSDYKFNNYEKFTLIQPRCNDDLLKIMVIHGNKDEIVPFDHGRVACRELGNCCKLVEAEGYSHNDVPLYSNGPFGVLIEQFLKG